MRAILKASTLPSEPLDALDDGAVNLGQSLLSSLLYYPHNRGVLLGVKLAWLQQAKAKLETFDVSALERDINRYAKLAVFTAGAPVLVIRRFPDFPALLSQSKL